MSGTVSAILDDMEREWAEKNPVMSDEAKAAERGNQILRETGTATRDPMGKFRELDAALLSFIGAADKAGARGDQLSKLDEIREALRGLSQEYAKVVSGI